jgi:excinuclease ABC subunit A
MRRLNAAFIGQHNLDVIRCADWIIDLGPEGGDRGGELIAQGTPEAVAQVAGSYTGKYLAKVLEQHPAG